MTIKNNPLIRKIINSQDIVLHYLDGLKVDSQSSKPKFLVNSFPKSGTHLLTQIIESTPSLKNYHRFITNATSFRFVERSELELVNIINNTLPMEMLTGHLKYNKNIIEVLNEKKFINFFIYRDPRDIVISEVFYLSEMNKWHKMSKHFRKLNTLEERINFDIKGSNTINNFPNIKERFMPFKEWINEPSVLAVKYEDIMSSKRNEKLKEIINFLTSQHDFNINQETLMNLIVKNMDPSKSHTYREGGSQKWKKYFTEEHKKTFKEVAGDLLIDLGYEENYDW